MGKINEEQEETKVLTEETAEQEEVKVQAEETAGQEENKVQAEEITVQEETKVQPEEENEELEETKVLTEEMKTALAEQEGEDAVDAKIRQGINEAAEEFKADQALAAATGEIVRESEPVLQGQNPAGNAPQGQPYQAQTNPGAAAGYRRPEGNAAGSQQERMNENRQANNNTMGGNKTMEENNRTDAAEIKTVYVKEKQRTGWWKIVMMILTILIALSFGLTALFSGISAWQLSRIANYQEASYYQSPGQYGYDPYDYYDDFGGYESEIPSDSGIADDGTADEYLDDIDLGDLFEYFGISGNNGSYGTETPADGSQENGTYRRNENTETNEADSLEDWFNNLFGTGDAGSTQSEQSF